MTLYWRPDKNPHTIEIGVWNIATQAQQWVDVSDFNPRVSVETAPAGGRTVQGTLHLEIPLEQDIYPFEAWNEIRVAGLVAGPPIGGYPRPFRGYVLQPTSQTRGLLKIYDFPLVDGWARVERSPGTIVTKRTYRGDDSEIIHAMAAQCMPELYPSGVATPSAPTVAATVTAHTTGGTLTAGKWRVVWAWSNPSGPTAFSPYAIPVITGTTGSLTVTIPGTLPAGATGAQIYMADAADSLTMVWAMDVPGPGTYTITDPPLGSLPPIAAIGPYPLDPTGDQPNVNNYSTVQPPGFGPLEVTVEAVRLAEALQAVIDAVPATYEVPRAMLWWLPDNAAHTAGWDWQLTWLRDSDTPIYAVVPSNVGNAGSGQEDFVHAYYYGYQRTRDGGPIINVQDVEGDWLETEGRYARAHVVSEVSQDEIGIYVSGKPIIDRDLKTDAECVARARSVMDPVKLPGETLAGIVTFVPFALLGATRVRLRNTLEGGLDTAVEADLPVYTIARCQGEWTDIGWKYTLDLGTGFAEIGQRRSGFRGGAGSTTSTQAPATPTWHDGGTGDQLDNSYDPVTHTVSLTASWNPNRETNLLAYYGRYYLNGATDWVYSEALPANVPPTWTIPGLPASTAASLRHVVVQVQAQNTHGVRSAWSTSRDFTPLAYQDAPAAPVWASAYSTATESATQGNATLTWTDGVGGSGTPATWQVKIVPHSGGQEVNLLVAVRSVLIHALLIGTTYDVTVQAFTATGDPGVVSAVKQIVVPQDSPGAPGTVTVTGARTGPGTGQATVAWSVGGAGINTYDVRYYATASGASTATVVHTPNDTRTLVIPGLGVGVSYTFQVRGVTVYGIAGPWSTSAPTLILAAEAPPAPTGLTVLDYDPGSTGQTAWILLGWTAGTGGTGTVGSYNVRVDWTDSATGTVRKWHKTGIPATDTRTILAPLTAGPSYTITMWAVTIWGDVSSAASTTYSITPAVTAALYNGSFELADPDTTTRPDGWTVTVNTGTATVSVSTTQVLDGARSVKIVRSGAGAAAVTLTSRRFAVQPGQWLYLTGALYGLYNVSCNVVPAVDFYQQDGSPSSGLIALSVFNAANPGPGWGQSSQLSSGTVPADAVTGVLQLTVNIDTSQTTVYLDGFTLSAGVITDRLAPAAVTTAKLAAGAVDSTALADGSVIAAKLGTSAVTNTKIQANAVSTTKIADDAVTQAKIAAAAVGPVELANGTLAKEHFGSNLAAVQKLGANPASPAPNDTVFRTDKGRIAYYDGTRWLTINPQSIVLPPTDFALPLSTSGVLAGRVGKPADFDWWISRWTLDCFVNGTNNPSNYWSLALRIYSGASTTTTLATLTTAAGANNTWIPLAATAGYSAPSSSTTVLEVIATKVGAPGTLYCMNTLTVQEVIP